MNIGYKFRVKNLEGQLNKWARAVNFVWNYCNDAQKHAVKWNQKWPSAFDLINATAGASKELGLSAETINAVCQQYQHSRAQHRKRYLRYRGKKSLGWIPLRGISIRPDGDGFRFFGKTFRVFNPRELPGKICDRSNFSRDAKGNWYLNLTIEVPDADVRAPDMSVGIDLGLKSLAVLSTGETIENPRHFRAIEERLGKAQRGRKRRQVANLHAKAANARRDFLHKHSTALVKRFDFIVVGNVNSAKLAKTRMAKSVKDVGWSMFRNMLRYKAIAHGATFEEVDESFSTRVCSSCACATGPKGVADLGIRQWECSECGTVHNRDQNSALNILARSGHRPLVEGAAPSGNAKR